MVHFPYSSLLISYCTKQMGCTSDGLASNFLCTGCNVSLCTDYQLKSQTHIWFIHAFHQLRSWDPCKSWKLNWGQLDFTKSSQDSMITSMSAVASSIMMIFVLFNIARQMQMSYFSPAERFPPFCSISYFSQFWSLLYLWRRSYKPESLITCRIVSSL